MKWAERIGSERNWPDKCRMDRNFEGRVIPPASLTCGHQGRFFRRIFFR